MVEKEDSITKAVAEMLSKRKECLPVFSKNSFLGIITAKEIIRRSFWHSETKVKHLISHPTIAKSKDVDKLRALALKSGTSIPQITTNRLILHSRYDIIDANKLSLNDVMEKPIVLESKDNLGKARNILRDRGQDIIVVVEKDKIIGIVDMFSLLKVIHPKYRMGEKERKGEKEHEKNIPLKEIVEKTSLFSRNVPLKSVVKRMKKERRPQIIEKNGRPIGMVTVESILKALSASGSKRVYVQIIGLTKKNGFIRKKVDSVIEKTLGKIGKMSKARRLTVYIKEYRKTGNNIKYSVKTRLETAKEVIISRDWSWNLIESVEEALDKLEREVISKLRRRIKKTRGRGY